MSKGMKWFTEEFLPSIEARMTNPKYPDSCILTPKQAEVCYKYMNDKYCRGDYGGFYNYEIVVNGTKYQMTSRGKYTFLIRSN